MDVEFPKWTEIRSFLKEAYTVWPLGLQKSAYLKLVKLQMEHPWSKRNACYAVLAQNGKVLSGCKLYHLDLLVGGSLLRTIGIGALYTAPEHRNLGYAKHLMKAVRNHAAASGHDLLALFSLIGTDFYCRLGYKSLSALDAYI